ncbi:hypothetical protein BSPWISOXPB_9674 [uncultured Gammaproteobacteria bacterium]|nr:hypothetical protein BSPWISOXPB_9674 [uncultured Gammaproteobacteria bacterium]
MCIILVVSVKFVGKHKRPKLVGKHKRPKLVGKHEGLLIGGLFFSFKGKK